MPIKALRLRIIKPHNEPDEEKPITWDDLGTTLRDLRYAASKMANYVIQKNCQWEFFRQEYKEENGEYPKSAEHKDKHYCYPVLTKMFPYVAGQMVNQIERHAKTVWNNRKKEVLSLRQSVPSFKLNFPILVHNDSYSIKPALALDHASHKTLKYVIKTNLASKITGHTSYELLVDAGEKSKQAILERIMSKEYRQGAMQIVSDRKKKWYCIIPYEFTVEKDESLDPNRIMGIDLGISKAVYWAFNDSWKRGWISGKEIEEFRRRVQARRKDIQEQGKYCGEGRIGHGVKRRLLPIDVLQEKEAKFRDTTNHRYAKHIIEEALRHRCGTIQMEELKGINELSTFLRNWTYHDLKTKIQNKAAEHGIEVISVNPQYTSQRCSECGYIDKQNRPNQSTFICQNCGYGDLYHCLSCGKNQKEAGNCIKCGEATKHMSVNADYNAARNIATPGIDTIIEQALAEIKEEGGEEKPVRANRKRAAKP